jgi:hypothetical protein
MDRRTPGQIRTLAKLILTLNELVEQQHQAILSDENATDE